MKKKITVIISVLCVLALAYVCDGKPLSERLVLDNHDVSVQEQVANGSPELQEAEQTNTATAKKEELVTNASFAATPHKDAYVPVEINFDYSGMDMRVNTKTLEGEAFEGESAFSKNRLTVLTVWSTTCPACIGTMPVWSEVAKEYEGSGVAFVGLCSDAAIGGGKTIDVARQILADNGICFTQLCINDDAIQKILSQMMYLPTTYFIDSTGKTVCAESIGYTEKEGLINTIETIMAHLAA